jgi:ADP-ribosylation factor-like protein 2
LHKLLLEERLAGATLLIFANKQDVAGSLSASDLENVLRLKDLGARHYKVVACSAVTGAGLDEGFSWLVGDIASRIFLLE